jgi:hypothetical protein
MKIFGRKVIKSLIPLFGAIFVLTAGAVVRAATVLELDFKQLVAKSDYIVVATVRGQTSRWNKHGRIVTDVALEVQETLKGEVAEGERLSVTNLGGTVGDIAMRVEGSPQFVSGATMLVFLREVPSLGELRVVGMSQGVLYFSDGPYGKIILPGGQGLALVQTDTSQVIIDGQTLSPTPAAASETLSEIRRLVSESALQ